MYIFIFIHCSENRAHCTALWASRVTWFGIEKLGNLGNLFIFLYFLFGFLMCPHSGLLRLFNTEILNLSAYFKL